QEALTLAEHCASVTIVHHHGAYAAQAAYRAAAEAQSKIVSVPESEVVAVLGEDAVTGARIRHTRTGETHDLPCEAVFVFVGLVPCTSLVTDRSLLDDTGHVVTDAAMRTPLPGLLAAGTVRAGNGYRAAAAAGDGAAAARSASRF